VNAITFFDEEIEAPCFHQICIPSKGMSSLETNDLELFSRLQETREGQMKVEYLAEPPAM
jgi:hypothetical protein